MRDGRFREDLLARINLWTFELPGLQKRREDIEPNVEYELDRFAAATGQNITFNKEGKAAFLAFATSAATVWTANFRDLNSAVKRMATLAPGGRINVPTVKEEVARLEASWRGAGGKGSGETEELLAEILGSRAEGLDRFDRAQLADVLTVCRESRSLSEAGRVLFAVSRARKKNPNDADRLRKYLARFGLTWQDVS